MSFEKFAFDQRINDAIKQAGFTIPTPIQQQAIGPVLEGRDVLGLAQTGTGKTAAFALPIIQNLQQGPRRRIRALVIAPTRELAEQIQQDFRNLGRFTNLKSVSVYGGVNIRGQISDLRRGTEIVIACPGRLLDLINRREINLDAVETLVIDEADRMFDMGFLPDIKRIIGYLNKKRQNLLFSATMPNDIRQLANQILRDPAVVAIDHSGPAKTVSHKLYPVKPDYKSELLLDILQSENMQSVLIFTRTKHRAVSLSRRLTKEGFPTANLQGNLSQNKRTQAMNAFRTGKVQILVATDIAARGLDVEGISHVINYDMPDTADAYTHRIGRTGRATRNGVAYTLSTREDERMIRSIEGFMGKKIERVHMPEFDWQRTPKVRTRRSAR